MKSSLIEAILQAQPQELDGICDALQRRHRILYPDEEIAFLSLPRYDREARIRILSLILDMEKKQAGDTDCHATRPVGLYRAQPPKAALSAE